MSEVDAAIERAERDYADDEATMWEDRRILAAEVKRLRRVLADCCDDGYGLEAR